MTDSGTQTTRTRSKPYEEALVKRFGEIRVVRREGGVPKLSDEAQAIKQALKEALKEPGDAPAPQLPEKAEAIKNALKEVLTEGSSSIKKVVSEKACDYIYRAVDRQINKARGVLAYNGLLFASFSFATRSSTDKAILWVANLGAITALASCLILLSLMLFVFNNPAEYENAASDFRSAFNAVWKRTTKLDVSIAVSLAATLAALSLPIIFLWLAV
jgi:hypothetical protein